MGSLNNIIIENLKMRVLFYSSVAIVASIASAIRLEELKA